MSELFIAGAARRKIEKETGQDLSSWSGPVVTPGQDGSYKVEWRSPDETLEWNDAVLTIYNDGVWELDLPDEKSFRGRMMVLHDRRWIRKLVKAGVYVEHAKGSWVHFKSLALGGRD